MATSAPDSLGYPRLPAASKTEKQPSKGTPFQGHAAPRPHRSKGVRGQPEMQDRETAIEGHTALRARRSKAASPQGQKKDLKKQEKQEKQKKLEKKKKKKKKKKTTDRACSLR